MPSHTPPVIQITSQDNAMQAAAPTIVPCVVAGVLLAATCWVPALALLIRACQPTGCAGFVWVEWRGLHRQHTAHHSCHVGVMRAAALTVSSTVKSTTAGTLLDVQHR